MAYTTLFNSDHHEHETGNPMDQLCSNLQVPNIYWRPRPWHMIQILGDFVHERATVENG